MHKRGKNRIKIMSMIAFLLLLGPLSWMVYGNDEKDITYSIREEAKEDGTVINLILEFLPNSNVEELSRIQMPDGSIEIAQDTVTFEATENREYKFIIYYKIFNENKEVLYEEKQELITYQVKSIKEKQEKSEEMESTIPLEIEGEGLIDPIDESSVNVDNKPEIYATGNVEINEQNFPDDAFREYLKTNTTDIKGYGTDGVFTPEELSSITNITVYWKNISTLQGIEYFTALTYLNCERNALSTLYLGNNSALTSLYCGYNRLTTVSIPRSPLKAFNADSQVATIEMHYKQGKWTSGYTYCGIESLDNKNIQYNYKTGEFQSSSTMNGTSTFVTKIYDGSKVWDMKGSVNLVYIDDFVPVTNITNLPTTTIVGETLVLGGTIVPAESTEKSITWSIKNIGTTGATLSYGRLTTKSSGTVVLIAKVAWGNKTSDYTKEFSVDVVYGNPSSLVCDIQGTLGKNSWYTSDVIIKPPTGYQIARTLGEVYTDSLTYSNEETPIVYLKNTGTGALYSGKTLNSIKVDKVNPLISGITNEGSEISNSNKTVTVQDVNLSSVKLYVADSPTGLNSATGTLQTITDGNSTVILKAANKDQYFKIVAEDLSGRITTYTYSLINPTYAVTVEALTFDAVDYNYTIMNSKKLNINYQANGANSEASITSIVPNDTEKFIISGSGKDWTVTPKTGLNAGVHTVTLTTTHTGGTTKSTVSMEVKKIANTFTINQADITYGGTVNPSTSGIKDNARVNYTYKVKGAADNTYTTTKPTNAGEYTVRGISEATTNYNSATVTKNFIIAKAPNPFTITQVDILYGGTINPTVSNIMENANLTYYYKLVSANDDAYTSTVPTIPGNYNIKAVSNETANYKTTEYITSFLIQYQLTASNACITIEEAKSIGSANDLKTFNQTDSNPTGIGNQISVSCTNLSSIQSGTPGNYEVKYTLLDITTTVKVQVVEGGYAVSEDRQTGFYGKDSKLTKGEAETITKEELLSQLEVKVITATGMLYEDTNKFMVDMDSIHSAGVGKNTIRIGFKEGIIDIEREVTIEILEDSPSAMISIPSSIELERVLHNETFEAVKEEKIEILSTVDTDKYSKNFYIKTEPSFTITNTEDSKEKFTVQIYDGKENKLTSKETPIAILNGSTKEERFYVKMYKGEKKKGIYKGTMNFEIGYGEGQ